MVIIDEGAQQPQRRILSSLRAIHIPRQTGKSPAVTADAELRDVTDVCEPDIRTRAAFEARRRILPTASVEPSCNPSWPGSFVVTWHGYQHGGIHFSLPDALQHALWLDERPAQEHDEWRAMHGEAA